MIQDLVYAGCPPTVNSAMLFDESVIWSYRPPVAPGGFRFPSHGLNSLLNVALSTLRHKSTRRRSGPYQPEDVGLPGREVPVEQSRFEFENVAAASAGGMTEPPPGVRFHREGFHFPVVDRTGTAALWPHVYVSGAGRAPRCRWKLRPK